MKCQQRTPRPRILQITLGSISQKFVNLKIYRKCDFQAFDWLKFTLIYKVTFFLNTGFIQPQGKSYDKFASQDFIILKYITDKIQKFNTTDEGAPLPNEDTCILDKNTSKTGQSSNSDYTPDCDTTFAKQVIDNKTKEGNTCSKQYVESIEIDTFAKQVIDNKTKEGNTCNKQYVESTEIDTFAKQVIDNKTKEGNTCNKQYVKSTEIDTFAK